MADQAQNYSQATGSEDPAFANIQDSLGDFHSIPVEQVQSAIATGQYKLANPQDIAQYKQEQQYGTPAQTGLAGLEAAGRAATFGGSTAIERALGVPGKDILSREAENPGTSFLGSGVGLGLSSLIPGVGEANVLHAAGEGAAAATDFGLAAKIATEGALLQGGDEISHMIAGDPNQSMQTAASNIGLAAVLGGAGGAALGAVSPAFESLSGSKVGKFIEDFKGRLQDQINNPDPGSALTNELQNYYDDTRGAASEVYGPTGIKSQDIQKLVPELGPKITTQALDMSQSLSSAVDEMAAKPNKYPEYLADKLKELNDNYQQDLSEADTSAKIFEASNKVKQTLQDMVKDSYLNPIRQIDPEYSFVNKVKGIASDFREGLEDPDVWGKAADRQRVINNAFKEYLPALKDFESKFTTKIGGERTIDPGKVQAYLNQSGKGAASARIRQEMLGNFIDASEKYRDVINESHRNLGIESPLRPASLQNAMGTLEEVTPGRRAADLFSQKVLAGAGGKGIGAAVGAGLGSIAGHPFWGAIVGEHALGPFFSSVLPSLIKPFLEYESSAQGAKAAADYGINVVRGDVAAKRAAKAIFKGEAEVIPSSMAAKSRDVEKLDERLKEINQNPQSLLNVGGHLGHYLPDHATAAGQFSANAVSYLESVRPKTMKMAPLDPEFPLTQQQKSDWARTLSVAQMPIAIMQHVKDGTLIPSDVQTIRTLYPQYYASLAQKVTNEMIDHISKGGTIPYKTRQSLSLFLGEPLDSSLTPQSIQSAQAIFATQASSSSNSGGVKRGTSKLPEFPNQFRTSEQSAEARRAGRE
jgi:hypothetical protein